MPAFAVIRRALLCAVAVGTAVWCAAPCSAQRVQFPSSAPGAAPYGGASVYPAAPAGTPVYPATPAPTGVYPTTPAPALPAYPAIAPPSTYDPYANPALGAPPTDVPYSALPSSPLNGPLGPPPSAVIGTPYPATAAPATGSTLFENTSTPRWSNSATYNYQNSDGTVARLQRFLQQISFEHTYLYGDHGPGDLEINRTEMSATFGVPIFYNPNTPLLITPGFAFNWLEGPVGPDADLPPRVYDAYLDAAWYPRFSPMLGADLGVRTGVWTDFEAVNTDSIRVLGRGLAVISISPRMDVLAGVWYLDRNRYPLLPAGGVHWKPNPEWDAYLVFPNPKVRKRFVTIGASQWWWYVAGEYGGGRWTIERDPAGVAMGADDDIDINDIRVIGGFEWETQTQARGHIEAGYVFDREIIYDGTRLPPQFDLDDTFMVRLGFDF
ncbi:MAG TPA: hypothetical protein VEQ85_01495 [Lacipirellulaceae bacterium]|nr:hypothetical protein [Lacipirellulaceae bacterium]